jgi:hypothetical protein
MARQAIARVTFADRTLYFHWADGSVYEFEFDKCPEHIIARAIEHGFTQKLRDSYSSAQSVEDAKRKWRSTATGLFGGTWTSRRSRVLEALLRVEAENGGVDEITLRRWHDLDAEGRKALAKHPAIRKMIARIELEELDDEDDSTPLF